MHIGGGKKRCESAALCACCRQTAIDANATVFARIASKPRMQSDLPALSISKLEGSILNFSNYGFTNSAKSTDIFIPDRVQWLEVVAEMWQPGPVELDMAKMWQFLDRHSHQEHRRRERREECSWCLVSHNVTRFVALLTRKAGQFDQRFQGRLASYGSSAERTKILSPDEFDFMVILDHFRQQASSADELVVGSSSCAEPADAAFLDGNGNVSSARLLYFYYQLLAAIDDRVDFFPVIPLGISYGETCVTLQLLHRPSRCCAQTLSVSVDITIGVVRRQPPTSRSPGYLVPHRQVDGQTASRWKCSYPLKETEILRKGGPEVRRCLALMKLFVLLANNNATLRRVERKAQPSSYAIKTSFLKYLVANPAPWRAQDAKLHLRGVCQVLLKPERVVHSFFDRQAVVYEMTEEAEHRVRHIDQRLSTKTTAINASPCDTTLADPTLEMQRRFSSCFNVFLSVRNFLCQQKIVGNS